MSAAATPTSKRRPVEPVGVVDAAKARLADAENAARVAAAELAKVKAEEAEAVEQYVLDSGKGAARVTAREVRERAELVLSRAQTAEATARRALDDLVRVERTRDYEAAITRATSVGSRLGPAFAKLVELEKQVRDLIDTQVADAVVDQNIAVEEAEKLAAILVPAVPLAARGVARLSMSDARYLAQVWVAHERSSSNLDDLPDGWVDGAREPKWNEPGRDAWTRACALLGLAPKEKS